MKRPVDAFPSEGVHIFYRESGHCEAIEFGAPACPLLDGNQILNVPFFEVEQLVGSLDPGFSVDESGLTSYALGLAVYCPGWEENRSMLVEGAFVFQRGYYDESE